MGRWLYSVAFAVLVISRLVCTLQDDSSARRVPSSPGRGKLPLRLFDGSPLIPVIPCLLKEVLLL